MCVLVQSFRCAYDFSRTVPRHMSSKKKYIQFGAAIAIILLTLSYLAYTGVQESKSYYVTIPELRAQGDTALTKRFRVAGNVETGSIKRQGTVVEFVLLENGHKLNVIYRGTEAPPDTFKDDSQALVEGSMGRDNVFHASHLQAKCASKYAPKKDETASFSAEPNQKSS